MDLQSRLDLGDPFTAQVPLRSHGRDVKINRHRVITAHGHLIGDSRNFQRGFVLTPVRSPIVAP